MSSVPMSTMADVSGKKKDTLAPKQQYGFYHASKYNDEKKERSHVFLWYALLITLLGLAIYARFFTRNGDLSADQLHKLEWTEAKVAKEWIDMAKKKVSSISFIYALVFGLLIATFSWMIVFFDSALPGKCPPSPFSSEVLRKQSGHTFHSGYVLAVVNGFVCTFLLCWM